MKNIRIGLFGFGCVGQGLYHALSNSTGFKADIAKIVVKNPGKTRIVSDELLSYSKEDVLSDPNIDVVVELIDNADDAYQIVCEAMRRGKHVVTANKKMLANHLPELYEMQIKYGVSMLYEASSCGSIPIIRSLEEYFDNEDLSSISGIFNGTTNYILTKTIGEGMSYRDALALAKERGFAESDPTNDVEGFDALYKTIIIAFHAFGLIVNPKEVFRIGITSLSDFDIVYASEKGYKIKLLPVIRHIAGNQVAVYVMPHFISPENHLYKVDDEYNGVVVEGDFSGQQFFQGKGAGSFPTGAAVLSDVSALSYGYKYEYKKHKQNQGVSFTNDYKVKVFLRFNEDSEVEKLGLTEIAERYYGNSFKYVVGYVTLASLHINSNFIIEKGLFISSFN